MVIDKARKHPLRMMIIFIVIILGTAASLSYIYETQFSSLEPPTPQEQPEIEASYSDETSELELEVVEGRFTKLGSRHVRLNQGNTNFTLEGYGEEQDTNYWAKGRFSLSPDGLTRFPISEGENISFEIEHVEPITIKTMDRGQEVNSHNIVFEDCEPQVYTKMYVLGNETRINEAGECLNQ